MGGRLAREESGFTLTEALVTMMLMLVAMSALYSVFDMSIRVFGYGNDKVEAVENARLGMDKMARELRAAYPYDRPDSKNYLFWNPASPSTGSAFPTATSITFGNDFNGSRRIHNPASGAPDSGEQITYSVSGGVLLRNGQPVVEYLKDVDGDGQALTIRYMDANGCELGTAGCPPATESNIRTVRVSLEVSLKRGIHDRPGTQILRTDVALRNRSG